MDALTAASPPAARPLPAAPGATAVARLDSRRGGSARGVVVATVCGDIAAAPGAGDERARAPRGTTATGPGVVAGAGGAGVGEVAWVGAGEGDISAVAAGAPKGEEPRATAGTRDGEGEVPAVALEDLASRRRTSVTAAHRRRRSRAACLAA